MHIPSKEQLKKISKFKKMPWDKFTASFLLEDPSNLEAFFYSKALFHFPYDERQFLLQELDKKIHDGEQKLTFQYFMFTFYWFDKYEEVLKQRVKDCSIENILSYMEFTLNRMLKTKTCIDGAIYPDDIIKSKHSFLLSVVPIILRIAQLESLPVTTKKLLKDNDESKIVLSLISKYHSVNRQITEVMKGTYIPKNISHIDTKYGANSSKNFNEKADFFLQRAPEHLDSIEIYNALNYELTYKEERDFEKYLSNMKEAGALKHSIEGESIHMDFSKVEEYSEVRKIRKIEELMESIYGSLECEVSYQALTFTIKDMIGLIRKIIQLSDDVSNYRYKNCKHVCIYKQSFSNLIRQLKLSDLEKSLLPLFSHELTSKNWSNVVNRPFINHDNTYYIFTPITDELSYEKVIDKILSQTGFKIRLPQKYKEKGIMFEDKINTLFTEAGFEVGQINRNEKKNIPEIDGLVSFDEQTVLVIEAKCTIKPEERTEVFTFIENHLSKAANQLKERVTFLTSNSRAANERLKFSVTGKKFIPIIVTNHSFFTGHKIITTEGIQVHCIDERLLNKIIAKNYIPSWEYTGLENNYVHTDKKLITKQDKLKAIIDPVANLLSKVHRTIQTTDFGVAMEIYKSPHFDREEQLKRSVDLQSV